MRALLKSGILTGALLALAVTLAGAQPAGFPFLFTPEPAVPGYLSVRLEGMTPAQAALHMLSYGRKWKSKKFTASAEEVGYFDAQRSLKKYLTRKPAPAGAVHLGMVGDVMWLPSQSNRFMTPDVMAYLAHFDALLGNLETPVDPGLPVSSPIFSPVRFNADPELLRSFRDSHGKNLFAALSLANNHAFDRGDSGANATLKLLDEEEIAHSGLGPKGAKRYCTFTRGGLKFGFYAACWGVNDAKKLASSKLTLEVVPGLAPEGVRTPDITELESVLQEMSRDGCDFKIVSLHWGFEFEYYPAPEIVKVGRRIAAAGADLIIGSHPHVQQPAEICFSNGYEKRYAGDPEAAAMPALQPDRGCLVTSADGRMRKTLILYSLGNFVTAMFTTLAQIGYIAGVDVYRDAAGAVDWSPIPGQFVYNRPPPMIGASSHPRQLLLVATEPTGIPQLETLVSGPAEKQKPIAFLKQHLGD